MSLSRKRKKELRRLQDEANKLWSAQQVIVGDAAHVAREAGRQLDNFRREQVVPTVQDVYEHRVRPVVDRGVQIVPRRRRPPRHPRRRRCDRNRPHRVGHRERQAHRNPAHDRVRPRRPRKSGPGIGTVIAIVLGVGAAIGVLFAAWQTLRADDELWVADDPLSAPEA